MDFITDYFGPEPLPAFKAGKLINKVLKALHFRLEINRLPDGEKEMITIEQRINLFHLLNQVLVFNVEGEIVEMGCHAGQSAMQIQHVLENYQPLREFHVFDKFNLESDTYCDMKGKLINNFNFQCYQLPTIHEGYFKDTIPNELPSKIAFAHIDCGSGAPVDLHKSIVLHCLHGIYPRMSKNAICLLMDYHDELKTVKGSKINPGVKLACDEFFKDKQEQVNILYGNHYSHGYFQKA